MGLRKRSFVMLLLHNSTCMEKVRLGAGVFDPTLCVLVKHSRFIFSNTPREIHSIEDDPINTCLMATKNWIENAT